MKLRNNSVFLLLCLTIACQHKDLPPKPPIWETSTQSVEVQGRAVLEFSLPDPFQKEEPVISSRPANASLAEIYKTSDGRWALRYQSLSGMPGGDKLSIDSENEEHDGPHPCFGDGVRPDDNHHDGDDHPHGRHHHPHDQEVFHRLNLEIQILPDQTGNTEKKQNKLQNSL